MTVMKAFSRVRRLIEPQVSSHPQNGRVAQAVNVLHPVAEMNAAGKGLRTESSLEAVSG